MDRKNSAIKTFLNRLGHGFLLSVTAIPTIAIVFILFFIVKESMPFFQNPGFVKDFFTSTAWAPSKEGDPRFGALSIFYGTFMVTAGSCAIAVPLGITVAVCLNEIMKPRIAGMLKPIVELLAAIPSVAYGFFAIVVFAPILQDHGGALISLLVLFTALPVAIVISVPFSSAVSGRIFANDKKKLKSAAQYLVMASFLLIPFALSFSLWDVEINSGTNALNASIILAIMALPTIVSISQDALASVGRDMREGSLALGSTRFESIFKVIIPFAKRGIAVAVILGFMRVIGETMVVWMASGNSLKIPEPFYNFLEPVRTLTATIAGEMGEADQSTGSARYHVLFAMSLCLLITGLVLNMASQWVGSSKFKKADK